MDGLSVAFDIRRVALVSLVDCGLVEDRETGGNFQTGGRLEIEGSGRIGGSVAPVEQGNGREVEPAVGHDPRIDQCAQVEGAGQFEVEPHAKHAFELSGIGFRGGKDEFEEDRRILLRAGQRDDAVGEKVVRPEPESAHHREFAYDIRNEILRPFVVAEVIAEQSLVFFPKFARGHFAVALEEFVGVEELSAWRFGQFETLGRIDFAERAQNGVAERPFRMPENVEAADPREDGESREEEKEDRPSQEIVLSAALPV